MICPRSWRRQTWFCAEAGRPPWRSWRPWQACGFGALPNVVHNHQEKNARVLERAGAAKVLLEGEATPEKLLETVSELLSDRPALEAMSRAMEDMAVENATDEITSLVLSLAAGE